MESSPPEKTQPPAMAYPFAIRYRPTLDYESVHRYDDPELKAIGNRLAEEQRFWMPHRPADIVSAFHEGRYAVLGRIYMDTHDRSERPNVLLDALAVRRDDLVAANLSVFDLARMPVWSGIGTSNGTAATGITLGTRLPAPSPEAQNLARRMQGIPARLGEENGGRLLDLLEPLSIDVIQAALAQVFPARDAGDLSFVIVPASLGNSVPRDSHLVVLTYPTNADKEMAQRDIYAYINSLPKIVCDDLWQRRLFNRLNDYVTIGEQLSEMANDARVDARRDADCFERLKRDMRQQRDELALELKGRRAPFIDDKKREELRQYVEQFYAARRPLALRQPVSAYQQPSGGAADWLMENWGNILIWALTLALAIVAILFITGHISLPFLGPEVPSVPPKAGVPR